MTDVDLRPEVTAAFAEAMGGEPDAFSYFVVNGFALGYDATRPLLVDLVAFTDQEHDVATNGCHYTPGTDCNTWCEACKLIARVPADVLAQARQQLREQGVERD